MTKKSKAPAQSGASALFVNEKTAQQESGTNGQRVQPVSSKAVRFAISEPLRDMPSPGPEKNGSIYFNGEGEGHEINEQNSIEVKHPVPGARVGVDTLIQQPAKKGGTDALSETNAPDSPLAMPTPALTFEGLSSQNNLNATGGSTVMPPDTEGDVGPNHYVQGVNIVFNVFDKTGAPLLGANGRLYSQLFAPIGGACSKRNDGDPIIQYDQWADRWMISQFCTANDPFNHQLMAISTTADPTGSYYLYDFQMPNIRFPDYPHYGIWHSGYFMTANVFRSTAQTIFVGEGAFAFDRQRMLNGDPAASMIYLDESIIDPSLFGQLPIDGEGYQAPPPTLPELFCSPLFAVFGDPIDGTRCFEFRPNFDNPNLTTFTVLPDIPIAAYDPREPSGRGDVEQPSPATTTQYLDAVSQRFMHRFTYRNFGTSASPVNSYLSNLTVNVSGVNPTTAATYQAGSRWTEYRRDPSSGAITVRDQGTYNSTGGGNGATGENDWMGSIAQDNQGNLALGFSASSTTLLPTIKWAGRTGAPSGTLDQGEAVMFSSTGVQQATNNRWGDYSSMNVDPTDDCTFWYTNEYRLLANQGATGTPPFLWNTRVGKFKFPTCTTSQRGTLTGTVIDSNGNPVAGAMVTTSNGYFRLTDASGHYTIDPMGVDSYTVTAFKRGIGAGPATVSNVGILNGNITALNLQLPPAADVVLAPSAAVTITEGQFSNGNGQVDPGETGNIVVNLTNPSASVPATNVTATLSVKNPTAGVTIAQPPTRNYGTIAPGATASNAGSPFRFILSNLTAVATTIDFVLRVDFGGGQSPEFLYFTYFVGTPTTALIVPTTTLDTTPPTVPAGAVSATTGTQTGRLSRSGVASGCGAQKANPGVIAGDTTARQYDAYVYSNNTTNALCVTVTVNQTGTELYTVAYGNGGFVPSNPSQNFLGDPGSSTSQMSYSFDVAPMSNYTIVVHDVTPPAGIGKAYDINIAAVSYGQPPLRKRANFDVDQKSDVSIWVPSTGAWISRDSATGATRSTNWGQNGDKPVPGDYDGDGRTDYAVYRPSEGNWYILNSFDGTQTLRNFGLSTDTPVQGDYDGDGKTDVAVFRPSEAKWYILQSYTNTIRSQSWGAATDKLAQADYDGDGKTDLAVFRPSEGNWYITLSGGGQIVRNWGVSNDLLVPADYDGDRKADIAVFRPSEGNWYIMLSAGGGLVRNWGGAADKPVPADYDGDGKTDIAVFRESEGNWYILNSSTGYTTSSFFTFGTVGVRPVPYDYIPNP